MPRPSRCGRSRSCPSCRRASSDSAGDRWSGRCRRSGRPACRCSPSGCPCPGPRVRCGRQFFRPARRSNSGRCRTARAPSASSRRAAASPDPRSSRARLSAALSRLAPSPLLVRGSMHGQPSRVRRGEPSKSSSAACSELGAGNWELGTRNLVPACSIVPALLALLALKCGGESGIRTHGRVSPTHAFQACSFNRSDISPRLCFQ